MEVIAEGKVYPSPEVFIEAEKAKYLPKPIEGVDVLVIIISTDAGLQGHIDWYLELLRATYGEGNVKVQGCGQEEVYRGYSRGGQEARQPVEDLWFVLRDFLTVEELATLLNIYAFADERYDQIHLVGHGDPDKGLLFRTGVKTGTDVSVAGPFDETKAGNISQSFQWPIKPGALVVLIGCEVYKGGLRSFIEGIVGPGNVPAMAGDFRCAFKKLDFDIKAPGVSIKESYKIPLDWYNREQEPCIAEIAGEIGIE